MARDRVFTSSQYRMAIDDLKKLIPKEALSRGSITNLSDLQNFFNMLNTDYSIMYFYKKRDNALEIARNEVMVHIAIAEAIERGDETRALEGIREDISGTKDDILKNFEAIEEQEVIF